MYAITNFYTKLIHYKMCLYLKSIRKILSKNDTDERNINLNSIFERKRQE